MLVVLARPGLAGDSVFPFWAFCLWFFRDPERQVPAGPVAVSPADGKVMSIVSEKSGLTRISIFLNVFDVHVNRTPVGGIVREVEYHRGEFLVASQEAASTRNEQNTVVVETEDGVRVMFKQIAGLIARRIVFNRKVGDRPAGRRTHRPDEVWLAHGCAARAGMGDHRGAAIRAYTPPPASSRGGGAARCAR